VTYSWSRRDGLRELRIEVARVDDIFAEATAGLAALLRVTEAVVPDRFPVLILADDLPTLLVEYAWDLVNLAVEERFVASHIERLELDEHGLKAVVSGGYVDSRNHVSTLQSGVFEVSRRRCVASLLIDEDPG
jgi:hypothetical protein